MADFPLKDQGGQTPLEIASTPNMDKVAQKGLCGLFCPIPDGLAPGSDIGNLSLFGYDPRSTFSGRAPLEAANQGIELGPNDIAFRCNLVTLTDGRMEDFTSGHISTEEATELIAALNNASADDSVKFYPGVSYRHLAMVSAPPETLENLAKLSCTPPHDITGKEYAPHLPTGTGSDLIRSHMEASRHLLANQPVNTARVDAGNKPATSIWLWGQGRSPSMQSFQERYALTGAVISAVDLVKGIGVCAGLNIIEVPGATGYLDTNYEGKLEAALSALQKVDFVYLHVEAPDEAGHEGSVEKKVRAIQDFDTKIVGPALAFAEKHDDLRILVAPDHVTSIESKTHAGGPIPFAVCGPGISHQGSNSYTEKEAKETGIVIAEGYQLTEHWIKDEEADFRFSSPNCQ